MERILRVKRDSLHCLHDVQAGTALLQFRTLPNLDVERPQLAQVTYRQFVCRYGDQGPRALAEAGDHEADVLVVMPKASSRSIAAIWISTIRGEEDGT